MASALLTSPAGISVATTDYPIIEADMSALLTTDSINSATTRLVGGGQQVNLPDAPILSGALVQQKINGSLLRAGTLYQLVWVLTLSTGEVISQQTSLTCPY